jgi:hypothetical protein
MWSSTHIEDNGEKSYFFCISDVLEPNMRDRLWQLVDRDLKDKYKDGYTNSGKKIDRQQLWFQRDGQYFCPSWQFRYPRWMSETAPDLLEPVQERILTAIRPILTPLNIKNVDFNSCLINKYRDGTAFITPHRDNVASFGANPTIVGLSLGATRVLRITHNQLKFVHDIELVDNSLFIMAGATQEYYVHEILQDPSCHEARYSLTFREHHSF